MPAERFAACDVALIVPTLDEEGAIFSVLATISVQCQDRVGLVVVVDGGSADQTRRLVESFAQQDARVQLFDNPAKLQAAGVSSAVRALPPHIRTFIRVDAHSDYPPDFIYRLLQAADRTRADSVVVRLRSEGRNTFGRAVGTLSNTIFGAGNSAHRMSGRSGWVDHGHHALFRREAFEGVGGYDVTFATNEDAELDVRLLAAGRRIWFENEVEIGYHPRETLTGLIRQYWRYGAGRAMTARKHRMQLKLRQALPVLLVSALGVAVLSAAAFPLMLLVPAAYIAACALVGVGFALRGGGTFMMLSVAILPAIHLSWGAGFIRGYLFGAQGLFRGHATAKTKRKDVNGFAIAPPGVPGQADVSPPEISIKAPLG